MFLPDDTDSRLLLITSKYDKREDTWKLASDHLENSVTKETKPDSLEALKLCTPTAEQRLMTVNPIKDLSICFCKERERN